MRSIVIRADSTVETGTGHIMRCIALAQGWQDIGGDVIFVCANLSPELELRLKNENIHVHYTDSAPGSTEDSSDTILHAKKTGATWIVVDGYHFGAEYQKSIKDAGLSLLFIDDYGHAGHYYADIILNQNACAEISFYQHRESYTKVLLGTKYSLLRRDFQKLADYLKTNPQVARKILITFGGSDPDNVTLKIIEAIKKIPVPDLEVIAVLGGINPHYDAITQACKEFPGILVKKNVDTMPELMAWADIAISGGGSTCWELAFMGVPSILCPIAENQVPIVQYLEKEGAVTCISQNALSNPNLTATIINDLLTSQTQRTQLSQKIKTLVDGGGTLCIFMSMNVKIFKLRPIKKSDCEKLWTWANDPAVRSSAFHQEPIPWSTHVEWFRQKLNDPRCIIFILSTRRELIGEIRFDLVGGTAEIDINVDRKFRGCGLGTYLIREGVRKFVETTKITAIHAMIKTQNKASIKMFENASFHPNGISRVEGTETVQMVWKGNNPI